METRASENISHINTPDTYLIRHRLTLSLVISLKCFYIILNSAHVPRWLKVKEEDFVACGVI